MVATDVDGDGTRELIVADEKQLQVFEETISEPAWSWTSNAAVELLETLPAQTGRPAVLAVRSERSVIGLDGKTGSARWRCDGPGHVLGVITTGGNRPVRIAFGDDSSVVFHDALPTTRDGIYESGSLSEQGKR